MYLFIDIIISIFFSPVAAEFFMYSLHTGEFVTVVRVPFALLLDESSKRR